MECIRPVAYYLAFPFVLSQIYNVFHISILRKYIQDPSYVLQSQSIELKENLSCPEASVQILGRKEKELQSWIIPLVKVLERNHKIEEATREREEMRAKYLYLFEFQGN